MANIIDRKTDETTGREVIIYDDGTRKDAATGHFLSGPPGKQINSSERGRQLQQIARDNAALDKARAFARKQGVDVDHATTDQLMAGFSQAREAIHGKAYDLFMDAKSARGIEGLYPKLVQVSDDPAVGFTEPYTPDDRLAAAAELLTKFKDMIEKSQSQPVEVIDGKLT